MPTTADGFTNEELIAQLKQHPGWDALCRWVQEQRDGYYLNLARTLYSRPGELAESDLDFKRGYWTGMARLLNEPKITAQSVERDLRRKDS